MPITAVYATKGGQGVTTTAAALAILNATTGARTLLVDTAHDQPAILGLPDPTGPGLGDYLQPASRTTLAQITTPLAENLDLIHRGDTDLIFATHTYGQLTGGLGHYDHVIIDTHNAAYAWTLHADRRLLVTRPCYLALRRSAVTPRPDAVVLINEHQRALNATDIETVLGIPVTATVPYHPAIARAIDAGLLTTRLPRELARALRPLLTTGTGR